MKQKIAYLDCHSGISGDMFLGALLDAGLPFATLQEQLALLSVKGYQITLEPFEDKGIRGARFDVKMDEQEQPHRHLADIEAILHASQLSTRVRDSALAIFRCLAEAEAHVHGTTIESVHFHEVGAIDAIVDITGAAIGIEALGITQLYASPLPLTTGHVKTAHGLLPVPAPATLEILRKVGAPWKSCPAEGELVTPTGAAILATLARFTTPSIAIQQVGYGFGRKRLPWPNCLRICLGEAHGAFDDEIAVADTDWVTVIEANIDDMSGELLGGAMEGLLAEGALDVSYAPIQMKKNRPATRITVICSPEQSEQLSLYLLQQTSTLGVRLQTMQRLKARREHRRIETAVGPMTVKVKRLGERIISAAPEYEECQHIARERQMVLSEVYAVAQQAIQTLIIRSREG